MPPWRVAQGRRRNPQSVHYGRGPDARHYISGKLPTVDLESETRETPLSDVLVQQFDVAADGVQVVVIRNDDAGGASVWLGRLDGRSPPRRLAPIHHARTAHFGAAGDVLRGRGRKYTVSLQGEQRRNCPRESSADAGPVFVRRVARRQMGGCPG
jgi:hypothetical protein